MIQTKHARGELGSYPIEEIVDRAVESFKEGVVEIWLTSEDTGAYGRDIGVTLPDLLWKLVEVIPDGCRLRIGMTNPPYILDHLDEIGKVYGQGFGIVIRNYHTYHFYSFAGFEPPECVQVHAYTGAKRERRRSVRHEKGVQKKRLHQGG